MRKAREDIRLPAGMDSAGLAHVLRTDSNGRLEISLADGVGVFRRMFVMTLAGGLVAGVGKLTYPNVAGADLSIVQATAQLFNAPVTTDLVLDLQINGVDAWRITVPAGDDALTTVPGAPVVWAAGDLLGLEVVTASSSSDLVLALVLQ